MRLYPPITFVPRVALEKVEIEGKRLPRGALVMIAPWTLQRHSKYWEDPHAFKPERFLPENEKSLTQGAYIPFGQGPHLCVGAGFAQVESLLIMSQLVSKFDFELIEEKTGEDWEIHGTKEDDEMEEPLPIPTTFCEAPVLYLVTDLSQPFMVENPFLAHWVVAYKSNIYDPSYFAPVESKVYSEISRRYLLRTIKKC